MAKGMILIGTANTRAPSWSSPEHAAQEYFNNRVGAGDWTPRPPVEKWLPDLRERFEKELARLEEERQAQRRERLAQLEREL